MNNEWKELKIDNLPPDILVGDYEWQCKENHHKDWYSATASIKNRIDMRARAIQDITEGEARYRYHPRQPEQTEHCPTCGSRDKGVRFFHAVTGPGIYSDARAEECKDPWHNATPTHEEIMTKWWLYADEASHRWYKVVGFDAKSNQPYKLAVDKGTVSYDRSWFTGRKSATIPPEASND